MKKIGYSWDLLGDGSYFKTKHFEIHMKKYQWYDVSDEMAAELKSIYPRIIEDYEDHNIDIPELIRSNWKVGIKRTFALGDLLMLVPIINHLNSITNNKYTLITKDCFIPTMKSLGIFHNVINTLSYKKEDFDKIVYLDGVLEFDHNPTRMDRLFHRVELYAKYFNVQIESYNWKVNHIPSKVEFVR